MIPQSFLLDLAHERSAELRRAPGRRRPYIPRSHHFVPRGRVVVGHLLLRWGAAMVETSRPTACAG